MTLIRAWRRHHPFATSFENQRASISIPHVFCIDWIVIHAGDIAPGATFLRIVFDGGTTIVCQVPFHYAYRLPIYREFDVLTITDWSKASVI
ncbi:MAG: hypothetical protein VYD10_03985 [Actinomycetota bacterium]|nr:hypothetical protein [Actinomycetota bacterium]